LTDDSPLPGIKPEFGGDIQPSAIGLELLKCTPLEMLVYSSLPRGSGGRVPRQVLDSVDRKPPPTTPE